MRSSDSRKRILRGIALHRRSLFAIESIDIRVYGSNGKIKRVVQISLKILRQANRNDD